MSRFAAIRDRIGVRAPGLCIGLLAATYVAACLLPGEPSPGERIEFRLDFQQPYRVPLAGSGEPSITIIADGRVLQNPSYRLESLDTAVVRVDASGRRVEGVGRGPASVRVVYQTAMGAPDTVFSVQGVVTRVAVDPPSLAFTRLGSSSRLSAVALDANNAIVPNVPFTWSSADTTVAEVNDTGLVTAADEGATAITAAADGVADSSGVTVTQVAAAVRVAPELDTLRTVGRSVQFIALALDSSGGLISTARPRWTSSDTTVARVDSTGRATATGAGTGRIIARVGAAADTATLVVAQVVRFLTVTPGFDTLTAIAETARIVALGLDSLSFPIPTPTITWATGDAAIATVDASGLVTATANGVVLVTASSGNQSAFATIVVRQAVATAQIVQDSVALAGPGDTVRLRAAGLDRNGYVVNGAVFTWRSSKEFVATVDTAGLVTAHFNGRTAIAATPASGGQPDTAMASVTGAPPPEALLIRTTTLGIQPDPDGYFAVVDGDSIRHVGTNDSVALGTIVGAHAVELTDVARNCTVGAANPRAVQVAVGDTVRVDFAVSCVVPVDSLIVTTTTTGMDLDPNGYRVCVDTDPYYGCYLFAWTVPVGVNGTVAFAPMAAGAHTVLLDDVAGNCSVVGANPESVTVTGGANVDVAFAIVCSPWAAIRATVTTTGTDPDPDGYHVRVVGPGGGGDLAVPANGTVVIPRLLGGAYTVSLEGIAINCSVTGLGQLTVSVAAGDTADVAFDVGCTTAEQLAVAMQVNGNTDIYLVKSNGTGLMPLTSHVARDAEPAWSASSGKIAFVSERDGNAEIYVMNADGSGQLRLTAHPGEDRYPAWSPDGLKLAFMSTRDGNYEIYLMNADGSSPVRLTNNGALDMEPAWSPDGLRIAFSSDRDGSYKIYRMNADGSGVTQLTFAGGEQHHQPDWSPSGTKIVYSSYYCPYYCDAYLVVINADGSGALPLGTGVAFDPVWSSDGRWIVFERGWCDYTQCYADVGVAGIRGDGTGLQSMVADAFQPAWRR